MNPIIYLAKLDDGTSRLKYSETKFINSMNEETPAHSHYASNINEGAVIEGIPDGLPQYFFYNGVDIEYVYPKEKTVLSWNELDFSRAILLPFKHAEYLPKQKSILQFDKIIFANHKLADLLVRVYPEMKKYSDKFYALDDGQDLPFLEYHAPGVRLNSSEFVKHYELSNKLINAVKTGDFKSMRWKG